MKKSSRTSSKTSQYYCVINTELAGGLFVLFFHPTAANISVCVCVLNLPLSAFLQEAAERLTLFTAEEEIFAFQRTVSRIMEMQTEKYWKEGDRSIGKKPT